jgi:NADH-quinone oxidoreductase subunit A
MLYIYIYRSLIIYVIIILIFSLFLLVFISLFNTRFWYSQSTHSVYECGFLPFHEARIQFESKFFMVALSFIIFDLEICFLIPWCLVYMYLSLFHLLFLYSFFIFIIVGLIYELQRGILDWNNK